MTRFKRFVSDAARLGFDAATVLRHATKDDFSESDHPRGSDGKFGSGGGGSSSKHDWSKYALAHTNAHKISGYGQIFENIKRGGEHIQELTDHYHEEAKKFATAMESSDDPATQKKAINKVKNDIMNGAGSVGAAAKIHKTLNEHLKSKMGQGAGKAETEGERRARQLREQKVR